MKLKLVRKGLESGESECRRNWVLSVEAVAMDADTDPNIFVFHAIPDDDPVMSDRFANVASLYDMNSIPTGAPATAPDGNFTPFYRMSSVTLDLLTASDAQRCWNVIKKDASSLVREWEAARNLQVQEEVELS